MRQGRGVWFEGNRLKRSFRGVALGTLAVSGVTAVCLPLRADLAIAGFLFLLVVLAQSLVGDLMAAILVSLEAAACLDYFFAEPVYSFQVASGVDVIALASFLATALVVTRLVSRVTAEAEAARSERQRLARLYRLAQQLMALDPHMELGAKFLERFQIVFGIRAVSYFDADTAALVLAGRSKTELAQMTRDSYLAGRDVEEPEQQVSIRRLGVGGRVIGCIGFEGLDEPERTADPLAALAATVIEKMRALRHASESAAAAQAESYRSAILDALAHEFKTPLATILAAAGGLQEVGPLLPAQLEMAETVETEAARLGGLASRLLRMARLDREEVKPRMEPLDIESVVEELIHQFARRSRDRQIRFARPSGPLRVFADPELLRLAVAQLLENACKYSQPDSTVSIEAGDWAGTVVIRVSNYGTPIPERERSRIFDRFYRGVNARNQTSGSGLGLYVARKIAVAHGGVLELDDSRNDGEIAFRLALPTLKKTEHALTNH